MRTVGYFCWLVIVSGCARVGGGASVSTGDAESKWKASHLSRYQKSGWEAFNRADLVGAAEQYRQGAEAAVREGADFAAGRFLANLGAMQLGQMENRVAMATLLEARRHADRAGDISTQQSIQANLANLYMQSGDREAALAAASVGTTLNPPSQPKYLRVRILFSFARVLSRASGLSAALPTYSRALQLAEEAGDPALISEGLDLVGYEFLRDGRLQSAYDPLSRAWWMRRKAKDPRLVLTEVKLARLFRLLGQAERARFWIERALPAAVRHARAVPEWTLWHERALIAEARGEMPAALAFHRMAISKAADWRAKSPPAERLLLSAELYLEDAFDGFLRVAGSRLAATGDSALAEEMLTVLHFNRAWSLDSPRSPVTAASAQGAGLLASARRLEARLLGGDLSAAPRLQALRISHAEAQAGHASRPKAEESLRPPGPGEAILTFHLGESRSWLWLWTSAGLRHQELPPKARILSAAAAFRQSVQTDSADFRGRGAELFHLLLGTLASEALRHPSWDIVVSDGLLQIPFAALVVDPSAREPFLIHRVQFRLIPNALSRPAPIPARRSLLAIADPIFNRADARLSLRPTDQSQVVHATQWAFEIPRLPGTATEVRQAAAPLSESGLPVRILEGASSSEESVLRALASPDASLVHFATHTVSPPSDPNRIHLALSLHPDGSPGLLSAEDIASCRTSAELVVLSACRSAAAPSAGGDGWLGLTRAWLRAGAQSVLATQWPIPDDNAALFAAFYKSLATASPRDPLPAAQALRQAQLSALAAGGPHSKPGYWSGYFLLARR